MEGVCVNLPHRPSIRQALFISKREVDSWTIYSKYVMFRAEWGVIRDLNTSDILWNSFFSR